MNVRRFVIAAVISLASIASLAAQPPGRGPGRGGGDHGGPPGRWWDRPEMVEKLKLTADQQKKLDEVFQQSRPRLIDLHAALEKEELALEPLMQAAQLDD